MTQWGMSGTIWQGAPVGRLKATGQQTQYSSELDDGYYEKGIAHSYLVRSTGQYSGTTNIDLAHYTSGAGAVTFDNTAKTIVDTGNGLAIFKTNDVILTDDPNNPGPFTVTTGNVAGTITCTGATFADGTPAGAITIKKREAHSNNVVEDLVTGLMYSRYVSDKMGAASDGKMPWTGVAYDIFAYVAAANTAVLGGHADWRVANIREIESLAEFETNPPVPDATAFPSFPSSDDIISSTTSPVATTNAFGTDFSVYDGVSRAKAGAEWVLLVRGTAPGL